jgi:superfamily II DNA or RNA helicase
LWSSKKTSRRNEKKTSEICVFSSSQPKKTSIKLMQSLVWIAPFRCISVYIKKTHKETNWYLSVHRRLRLDYNDAMVVPNKHRQQKASEEKHYIVATIKSLIRAREKKEKKDRGKNRETYRRTSDDNCKASIIVINLSQSSCSPLYSEMFFPSLFLSY